MAATRLVTVEDLETMAPDGNRYALYRGVLQRVTAAGGRHGEVSADLARWIGNHAVEQGLGRVYSSDTGFVLARDPDVVFMPDVAFVRADRLPAEEEREGIMPLAPDVVAEVVSPTDRWTDVEENVALYLVGGVRVVVVVDFRRRVVSTRRQGEAPEDLGEGDVSEVRDVLPGFRLPVAEVFR